MLKTFQKTLKSNQTPIELALWQQLRNRRFKGFKFRRQYILQGYIVDFVCLKERLIIELDGGQHGAKIKYDAARTSKFENNGFRLIRFWNNDFLNHRDVVLDVIYQTLMRRNENSGE